MTSPRKAAFPECVLSTRGPNLRSANFAPVDEVFFTPVHKQVTDSILNFGAGEAIRTPDPNLGKVPEGSTPGYPTLSDFILYSYISMTYTLIEPAGHLPQ